MMVASRKLTGIFHLFLCLNSENRYPRNNSADVHACIFGEVWEINGVLLVASHMPEIDNYDTFFPPHILIQVS